MKEQSMMVSGNYSLTNDRSQKTRQVFQKGAGCRGIGLTALMAVFFSLFWYGPAYAAPDNNISVTERLTHCEFPQLEFSSIIYYENYAKAYLKFTDNNLKLILYKLHGSADMYQEATVNSGEAVLFNLQPDQLYEIKMQNDCGESDEAIEINTHNEQAEIVEVSNRLYDHIAEYLRNNDRTPFPDFLNGLEDINPYEKVAFVQQFFFKGAVFTEDLAEVVPIPPDPVEPTDCFCNYIRTSAMAAPANMNFASGIIQEYMEPGGGVKTNLGDPDTDTWHYYNNKGAAKWHQLYAEGYNSTPGSDYDVTVSWHDGNLISYQQNWIRMSLICMDGDRVPQECACEKTVKFWYRYDAKVTAYAEAKDGKWNYSENAVAMAEDMAIATFMEESSPITFEVLKSSLARTESHCDRSVNPNFWTNLATVGTNAATLALSILAVTGAGGANIPAATITQVSNQIKNYYSSIATQINTPFYNPANCDNERTEYGSMDGYHPAKLRPNVPVILTVNSFDKLSAGGRRAWHSFGRVNSNCYIATIIDHNSYDGTPKHCCSPKVAAWVLGSIDGPWSTDQLKIAVAEIFYTAGMNNLTPTNMGNGHTLPREFGYLSQASSDPACNRIVVNQGKGINTSAVLENSNRFDHLSNFQSLSVWDVSGRQIANFTAQDLKYLDPSGINNMVNQKLSSLTPGIYFLNLLANGEVSTHKVVVH